MNSTTAMKKGVHEGIGLDAAERSSFRASTSISCDRTASKYPWPMFLSSEIPEFFQQTIRRRGSNVAVGRINSFDNNVKKRLATVRRSALETSPDAKRMPEGPFSMPQRTNDRLEFLWRNKVSTPADSRFRALRLCD